MHACSERSVLASQSVLTLYSFPFELHNVQIYKLYNIYKYFFKLFTNVQIEGIAMVVLWLARVYIGFVSKGIVVCIL